MGKSRSTLDSLSKVVEYSYEFALRFGAPLARLTILLR